MVISVTLDAINKTGNKQGYPKGPAKLGYFVEGETKTAAGNVFVLVVHYDFKYGEGEWPRPGDEQDVENLRKTFAENRNCAFRECSPKREDLLALLVDEQKLKRFFGASEEPDVFFFIVLSHGAADGVIFTDFLRSSDPNDYEFFTTKELFKSLENAFPKSLKTVILGPCRGPLEDVGFHPSQVRAGRKNDPQEIQNPTRVSFEPKMRNLIILYSTVETTYSARNEGAGTWLIKFLCDELDGIRQDQGLVQFLTGVQNRIHRESFGLHKQTGQTPEFKLFPCVRKFVIKALPSFASKVGTNSNGGKIVRFVEKPRSIHFDWIDPETDKVLRGRRAVIFHQGEENKLMKKLDSALVMNLGFETTRAKLDKDGLDYYFSQSQKSWIEYGCFAAFFFAEIAEQEEGEVCIRLDENEKVPIGELIHRLLGQKNTDWVGKPKLFFLIDTKVAATDSTPKAKSIKTVDILRATNHSGWLLFVLRNKNSLEKFVDIFQNQEIKSTKSLQESLADLLLERTNEKPKEGMMVSTLPNLLSFSDIRGNFIQPKFLVNKKGFEPEMMKWNEFLKSKEITEENRIWLLSSDPGSGKSTVMRELAFELQRKLRGEIKVFLVGLSDTYGRLGKEKKERRKVPSLASVVSHATGNRDTEIQDLIDKKKIMLMFDGFDEICPFYREQILQIFTKAVKEKVPTWISTRPHEEDAMLAKLGKGNQVSRVQILPFDSSQQRSLLMMISNKSDEECSQRIKNYRESGLEDILINPLHLTMIAELPDSDYKIGSNLYEIYEKNVDTKLRLALNYFSGPLLEKALISGEKELKIAAAKFQCNRKSEVLKNTNNGIVTISNGRAQFVHQTFAEFLTAAHFVDCLVKEEEEELPFDIFRDGFSQIRKFADMKVSTISEKSNFPTRIESYLKKVLTKSILKDVILKENLGSFGSAAANLVTFNPTKPKRLNFVADHILELASSENENFALGLLKNGAYENLAEPNTAVAKILANAIENNFAHLFTEIGEKCANLMELVRNNEKIMEAVEKACKKNYQKVLRLVFEKGIIGSNDQDALNVALKSAVQENSIECVELLIEHGARTDSLNYLSRDLNIKTTEVLLKTKGKPMLKLASRICNRSIEFANAKVAKFLFEIFGDAENAEFEVSSRALIDVARWSHDYDTAQMLCHWLLEKRGFQVREKDKYGRYAFHCAVEKGNKGLVKYFLEKDPGLSKTLTNEGENAMHLILSALDSERKIEMCKYLNNLDAEMVRQKTAKSKTILHLAAQDGKLEVCRWLVEEIGLEVDAVDDDGWNAIHFAVSDKVELELLEYLNGVNGDLVRQKTKSNNTVLHFAAEKGKLEVCKWLAEEVGVEVDAVDNCGWNAMHFAASDHNVEIKLLEYLHEKSPQLIEKRTNKNETALHLVAKNEEGKVNIYNWFVKKGVDESVQNSEGKTALQEAHVYFLTEFK